MKTWCSEMRTIEVVDNVATGKALKKLREKEGISLRRLATKMGISPSYLSDLENANRNWTKILHDRYIERLNKLLGEKK